MDRSNTIARRGAFLILAFIVSLYLPATARAQGTEAGSQAGPSNPAAMQQAQGSSRAQKPAESQKPDAQKPTEGAKPQEEQPPRIETEVFVTAPRLEIPLKENPASTSVIGEPVLARIPRGVGAEEPLQAVPGMKVDNQAGGQRVHLSIRGQGLLTERGIRGITVLLDGLPLNDPSGFAPDLARQGPPG